MILKKVVVLMDMGTAMVMVMVVNMGIIATQMVVSILMIMKSKNK